MNSTWGHIAPNTEIWPVGIDRHYTLTRLSVNTYNVVTNVEKLISLPPPALYGGCAEDSRRQASAIATAADLRSRLQIVSPARGGGGVLWGGGDAGSARNRRRAHAARPLPPVITLTSSPLTVRWSYLIGGGMRWIEQRSFKKSTLDSKDNRVSN